MEKELLRWLVQRAMYMAVAMALVRGKNKAMAVGIMAKAIAS